MTDKDIKTVKELAERIKVEFYAQFDELIPSVMSDRIDELVKEVLQEEKTVEKEAYEEMYKKMWNVLIDISEECSEYPIENFLEKFTHCLIEHKVRVLSYDIGETVYCLMGLIKKTITPCEVKAIAIDKKGLVYTVQVGYMELYLLEDEIFPTQEEAEKALEEKLGKEVEQD